MAISSAKRVAKKKIDAKEQKGLFLLGFEPESGVSYTIRIQICTVFFSKIRRIYRTVYYLSKYLYGSGQPYKCVTLPLRSVTPLTQVDGVEATAEQLEAVHDHDLIWLVRSAR